MFFGLLIISVVFGLLGAFVSNRLKSRFKQYSKLNLSSGLSGKEVAEKMLRENKIHDVKVISTPGFLSDHYNPLKKTVNLSNEVYNGRSISSAAVAAHECGHAVQHARSYKWLGLRSTLVPIQNVSGKIVNIVVMASMVGGFLLFQAFPMDIVLLIIIACYSVMTLFSLVTLPVEFDASKRALVWLNQANITAPGEHEKATNALKWAASTYAVAALASLVTLLYYIMIFMGRRD